MSGTPLYVVGKALGHRTLMMTARYSHLAPDSHRAAFEAVAKNGKMTITHHQAANKETE